MTPHYARRNFINAKMLRCHCILVPILMIMVVAYISSNHVTFNFTKAFVDTNISSIKKTCKIFKRNTVNISNTNSFNKSMLKPSCNNFLINVTNGIWQLKKDVNTSELAELKNAQRTFRSFLNWPKVLWRNDGKCGYMQSVNANGQGFTSICDPNKLSCCTDYQSGFCVENKSTSCKGNRCFDSSKLLFPILADWIIEDNRCVWHNYSASEACLLLNNVHTMDGNSVSSVNKHFHFFGDSLVHNMYLGLLIILSGRKNTGTWQTCISKHLKHLCYGQNQFYYMPCLTEATSNNLNEIDDGLMCGEQGRFFDVTFKTFFSVDFKDEMLQYVAALLDKPNNFITMGIGVLERCRSERVLNNYIKPVVELIRTSKSGWPKIIWVHPLRIGVVSPVSYWGGLNNDDVSAYIDELDRYLQTEKIPTLNFRKLTCNVHSHDGTHYGIGLNLMKVQIWLNYLADTYL